MIAGAWAVFLAQVELRALEAAPAGTVAAVGERGVEVGEPGSTVVVTWDRVRAVGGEHAPEAAPYLSAATRAWRARTRLERGDAIGAEPLLEELFREGRLRTGPSAAVIAEGLLRCRLRRGAHVLAAEAWLALLRSKADDGPPALHPDWAGEAGLPPVIDPATGLAAAIPPIWCGPNAAQVMAGLPALGGSEAGGDKASRLAALYAAAAQFEAGRAAPVPAGDPSDPGVALVHQIVLSRIGDAGQRQAARAALEGRLPPASPGSAPLSATPTWLEAWCRVAIGRSLLREESREEKQLGVLALLHVPARLASAHPYLTGVALAEAAVALRDLGDSHGGDFLLNELRVLYPDHPVWEWNAIRLHPPAPPARPAPAGPDATPPDGSRTK